MEYHRHIYLLYGLSVGKWTAEMGWAVVMRNRVLEAKDAMVVYREKIIQRISNIDNIDY